MTGKQNLDNLMRKVIKVSPDELKRRLEAEKKASPKAKRTSQVNASDEGNILLATRDYRTGNYPRVGTTADA